MSEEFTFNQWRITLELYVREHVPVGSFLQAVGRADWDNLRNLPAFAAYVYNEMPHGSHGSPSAYAQWINGGMK